MDETSVDRLFNEFAYLKGLISVEELSARTSINEIGGKSLILATGSHFENELRKSIISFAEECSGNNDLLKNFIDLQALDRKYHTLFNWESNNANSFFSKFGGDFKNYMIDEIKKDSELDVSIKVFLFLGNLRNQIAHKDYASFALGDTPENYYEKYKVARYFISEFPKKLRSFINC